MIDIHCHLLPGLDDGPASMDDTVMMCRLAARDGIRAIIATPHANSQYSPCPEQMRQYVQILNNALQKNGLDLTIYPGAEVHLLPDMHATISEKPWLRLADSRYVLVEPPMVLPQRLKEEIFQLRLAGYVPILAHPERCACVQENPDILLPLVAAGMLVQITAQSLLGDFGTGCMLCAETLIRCRTAHIVASDAHAPLRRPPLLSAAFHRLKELLPSEDALAMVWDRPESILKNRRITLQEPIAWKTTVRPNFLARLGMTF